MNRHSNPPALPSGFVIIKDVLEQSIAVGKLIGVIGLVKDRRTPMPSRGTDWKSSLTIYDKSIEDDPGAGLPINIFRSQKEMPEPDAGDVLVISHIKVQLYRGEVSLLTHWDTVISVYSANEIPRPPKSAKQALAPPLRQKDKLPGDDAHEYVAWLYHNINKDAVPDAETFCFKVDQSRNVKQKFQTLDNVQDSQFYDVIVNVIKDPYDEMGMATLWVTDYTENQAFYKFSLDTSQVSEGREGDPYGYTKTKIPASRSWPGPYGNRSMQITCFGIHGDFITEKVKAGDWVHLRNLHVKYGHNASNLEGKLHEDRGSFNSGLRVDILRLDDPENVDDRLKDALKRKRDYEKNKKKQLKSFTANEGSKENGTKRKAGKQREGEMNSKQRRMEQRAAEARKVEERERQRQREGEAKLGLNTNVKCESSDQPIYPVSTIMKPVPWTTKVQGQDVTLTLPFTCAKYRANVRVVDFRPNKLEDFATWRKNTEFDIISQDSGASDSESSGEDQDPGTLDRYAGTKTWEWKFALQLEEADPKHKTEGDRFWAVVDNIEGQQLTNLDALDLRANPDELETLREQLFKLWGNLEEHKQQELQWQLHNQRRFAAQQPPDSSPPPESSSRQTGTTAKNPKQLTVSNKPFTCCIRQYGIKVAEKDPRKANAGDGRRWERVFGLFGTKICS